MSFFDDVPSPAPPIRAPEVKPHEWAGPARGEVPAISTQQAVLLKSDEIAVVVDSIRVYSNGVEFRIAVQARSRQKRAADPFSSLLDRSEGPKNLLHYGLLLADGTKWTGFDERFRANEDDVEGPIILRRNGGSDGRTHYQRHWIWPLPPPSVITFIARWPAHNLDERTTEIDANELRSLSSRAQVLWPI